MLDTIENAICEKYIAIRDTGKILDGIEAVHRHLRFKDPELAEHIRKRLLAIANEKGDLP